jgi:hypothetical protein
MRLSSPETLRWLRCGGRRLDNLRFSLSPCPTRRYSCEYCLKSALAAFGRADTPHLQTHLPPSFSRSYPSLPIIFTSEKINKGATIHRGIPPTPFAGLNPPFASGQAALRVEPSTERLRSGSRGKMGGSSRETTPHAPDFFATGMGGSQINPPL